jgi:hypothetical protein
MKKYEIVLGKMNVLPENPVKYFLQAEEGAISMNDFIGHDLEMEFTGEIYCINCGKRTGKSFGQGYCYPCFITSPETEECVFRPELCRAHLGIARDMEYAKENCLQEHYVYLASSSDIKIGVTRKSQIPVRWIDQGAGSAIKIALTPNRYYAGLIEVELKKHLPDKTNWRAMLTNKIMGNPDFRRVFNSVGSILPESLKEFLIEGDEIFKIFYPVSHYPVKVNSINLDRNFKLNGKLTGIKGQYLIFENGDVINIRKYSGYKVILKGNAGNKNI